MAFEKAFENKYEDLPEQTKYRFAEIELHLAINALSQFSKYDPMGREKAVKYIYHAIAPTYKRNVEFEDMFFRTLSSNYFNNPPKSEIIYFLIMKGHTYSKIRNITSASFNTISKMRYGMPNFYPVFNMWDEELLSTWNRLKRHINIFNEELAHTK